jgi:hypothetical protein
MRRQTNIDSIYGQKNLCSNYYVSYENENLLRNNGSKDTSSVLRVTTISLERLMRLS